MGVTLDEILTLAGHLDDAPGFDAPRQRFRRFLVEHARDAQTARQLVEHARNAPGEQHRRALQDLIVLLGQFLGFSVAFGSYDGPLRGRWRSRSRLNVVVDLCPDQIGAAENVEELLQAVSTLTPESLGAGARLMSLQVLIAPHVNRADVEASLSAANIPVPVVVMALSTLLSLADLAHNHRVTHDDIVHLFEAAAPMEFIVALLGRVVEPRKADAPHVRPGSSADEPGFWMATVARDHGATPEEFLELVVGRRHIFGVTDDSSGGNGVRPGDSICFYIAGVGIVGHARVQLLPDGSPGIRDPQHYRQLIQLERVELHLDSPIALDFETQLRLRTVGRTTRHAHTMIRISRESFRTFTAEREKYNPPVKQPLVVATTAAGSRSPE